MVNEKTSILFKLGNESRNHEDWLDYLQYGFDESDVQTLLGMVADESLHGADIDSNEAWVPMHAWRTLGQIGSAEAVEPLLALFDEIVDDDWALSEFPIVMSMIGESSIEPLTRYLRESGHDEFSLVMAADALKTIAESYPASKERIVRVLTTYLDAPDASMLTLNGLIVVFLLDLEAKTSIETLRRLYKNNQVDITCAGDLEDVEITLGFRAERDTPRPHYEEQAEEPQEPHQRPVKRPQTEDVFELLTYYLDRFGHDDSALDVSELDGFFAALNCSPFVIPPSQWLDAIWGGESLSPEWPSKKAYEEFTRLAFIHYHHVQESLEQGKLDAIYLERDEGEITHIIVDEWCAGFLKGIDLWPPLPPQDADQVARCTRLIEPFATEEGWAKIDALSLEEVQAAQARIEPAVEALFQHFEAQRKLARTPLKRDAPKISRNDPCPCGSGKKYKKCCLNKS